MESYRLLEPYVTNDLRDRESHHAVGRVYRQNG
jgi:hypothetical protein